MVCIVKINNAQIGLCDAAVLPVTTPQFQPDMNDVGSIRFRDLATQEELDDSMTLEIGVEIVAGGLVPQVLAQAATNVLFFRFGRVSLLVSRK